MKMIFDHDGTTTDFNAWVDKHAISYFAEKYDMKIVNPNALEIEDKFDMLNFFINKYKVSVDEAKGMQKKVLDKFWISLRFVDFSLLSKLRPDFAMFLNKQLKNGERVEIHTSRAKTANDDIVGAIARNFTKMQYILSGVYLKDDSFFFYPNDEEKIKGVIASSPDVAFDDKPNMISAFNNVGIKTLTVPGVHNTDIENSKLNYRLLNTSDEELNFGLKKVIGSKSMDYHKRINESGRVYKKITILSKPIEMAFKPIILNEQNIITPNDAIIYAPNHRSTIDPLVIQNALKNKHIHWAALKRFFDGKDSIFNNSKNPYLCKLTADFFKKLEYIPIDRKKDNPNASNASAIKDMVGFLNLKQAIGIFPEGTTNKDPNRTFGEFDDAFIHLAKRTNAWIQPITGLWLKDMDLNYKCIFNFSEAFKIDDMSVTEAYDYYMLLQQKAFDDNLEKKNDLIKSLKR